MLQSRLTGSTALSDRSSALAARNDNTFARATNLGTVIIGRPFFFNVRGSVGPSDRVDVYRYQVRNGVEVASSSRIAATSRGVRVEVFSQLGRGPIRRSATLTARPGAPFVGSGSESNPTPQVRTLYLRVLPIGGSSTYRIQFLTNPATNSPTNSRTRTRS